MRAGRLAPWRPEFGLDGPAWQKNVIFSRRLPLIARSFGCFLSADPASTIGCALLDTLVLERVRSYVAAWRFVCRHGI